MRGHHANDLVRPGNRLRPVDRIRDRERVPVKQLHPRAIGIDRPQPLRAENVLVLVFPAAKEDRAVVAHRGRGVAKRVVFEPAQMAAVAVHDVQRRRQKILAERIRLHPRGVEDDAPVRQIRRAEVMIAPRGQLPQPRAVEVDLVNVVRVLPLADFLLVGEHDPLRIEGQAQVKDETLRVIEDRPRARLGMRRVIQADRRADARAVRVHGGVRAAQAVVLALEEDDRRTIPQRRPQVRALKRRRRQFRKAALAHRGGEQQQDNHAGDAKHGPADRRSLGREIQAPPGSGAEAAPPRLRITRMVAQEGEGEPTAHLRQAAPRRAEKWGARSRRLGGTPSIASQSAFGKMGTGWNRSRPDSDPERDSNPPAQGCRASEIERHGHFSFKVLSIIWMTAFV